MARGTHLHMYTPILWEQGTVVLELTQAASICEDNSIASYLYTFSLHAYITKDSVITTIALYEFSSLHYFSRLLVSSEHGTSQSHHFGNQLCMLFSNKTQAITEVP